MFTETFITIQCCWHREFKFGSGRFRKIGRDPIIDNLCTQPRESDLCAVGNRESLKDLKCGSKDLSVLEDPFGTVEKVIDVRVGGGWEIKYDNCNIPEGRRRGLN